MATHYPGLNTWRIAIPITTALLSTLGAATGLYGLLSPGPDVAKMFGILLPPTLKHDAEADARQKAYIQIYAIRNVASGIGGLALIAFWRLSETCQSSSVAARAVQKAIAITYAVGTVVALGDGLIVGGFGRSKGVSGEQRRVAEQTGPGHVSFSLPLVPLAVAWWYYL